MLTEKFGVRLKKFRLQRGMTPRELSEASGVTTNSIWRYENGFNCPYLLTVELLLNALKVTFAEFFEED